MKGNNDDNQNRFNYQSNFSSFSKVCYSDPNNPGKMICKETNNTNGNQNEKEYSIDMQNNRRFDNRENYNQFSLSDNTPSM